MDKKIKERWKGEKGWILHGEVNEAASGRRVNLSLMSFRL